MAEDSKNINEDTDSSFVGTTESNMGIDFNNIGSDQFSNISPLYSSNSGVINLYTATRYGKRYVLKSLSDSYRKDPVWLLALRKEFEIGITLDHPNIRRTIGFENVPELGYTIILEYVDGDTLEKMLAKGAIKRENAREIVRELADAIHYLHKKQIVHRDIKPSNIIITYSGNNVKLIDFSLADDDTFMIIKKPAGTRRYMAPEQMNPDANPSQSADIYSFGKTLNDIASAINDKKLLKLSEQCCDNSPDSRPKSISDLEFPQINKDSSIRNLLSLESKFLTFLLVLIVTGLLLFISIRLYYRIN